MAITINYNLTNTSSATLAGQTGGGDAIGTPENGFALISTKGLNTSGTANGVAIGAAGWDGAIARLSNGHFVIATEDSNSIRFQTLKPDGSAAYNWTDVGDLASYNPDAVGLAGGGFVVANHDHIDKLNYDIDARIYENDGTLRAQLAVTTSGHNDRDVSVTPLKNGNFALVWTRTVSNGTQTWYAVYDKHGNSILSPSVLDATGKDNRDASICATDQGFAVAYENNDGDGVSAITLAQFNSNGGFIRSDEVSQLPGRNELPTVAEIGEGLLAVSFGNNPPYVQGDDYTGVMLRIVDAATGQVVADGSVPTGPNFTRHDSANVAIAATSSGKILAMGHDLDAGTVTADQLLLRKTISGDESDNVLKGGEFIDTIDGKAGKDKLYGGGNDDTLLGGEGKDLLDGGTGIDFMQGGAGSDTYVVDSTADKVIETIAGENDLVRSSASFSLGSFVEMLMLTGTADINGNGNSLDNLILGNAGNNKLSGGVGNDILSGGAGNDNINGGSGIDTVSYADAAGGVTVSLATSLAQDTGGAGTDTLHYFENIVGSAFDDDLTGNSAANRIDGGAGADVMAGGGEGDLYIVDNKNDVVVEAAGQGYDEVLSSVSHVLGDNVEELQLTGSAKANATGNDLMTNMIVGNDGRNIITGNGGQDYMFGGGDVDRFDFNAVSDSSIVHFDIIHDLAAEDRIDLSTIDANATADGNQVFKMVAGFTGKAGQVFLEYDDANFITFVHGDVNGDSAADFTIGIEGNHLDFSGFLL